MTNSTYTPVPTSTLVAAAATATAAAAAAEDPPDLTVLRCSSTADFLAALPRLVGFTAPDSLFVVLFSGKRSESTLRIDLPESDDPRAVSYFISQVVELLEHAGKQFDASSPAVVITSSTTFADAEGQPWRALARGLKRRLERRRIYLRELCCVAPDGWVSFLDPAAPRFGRPLSEISTSKHAVFGPEQTLDGLGEFPEPAPHDYAAVQAALQDPARLVPSRTIDELVTRIYEVGIDALLHDGAPPHNAQAALIWYVQSPSNWNSVWAILTLLAGASLDRIDTAEVWSLIWPAGTVPDPPRDAENSRAAAPPSARAAAPPSARDAAALLRLAAERLTELVLLAPVQYRASVAALSAGAWWLRGLQTVAWKQLAAAEEYDPDDPFVLFLRREFQESGYPLNHESRYH